jgi:hypothetical protein
VGGRLGARRAMTHRNSGSYYRQCCPNPGCRCSHVGHIAAPYRIVTNPVERLNVERPKLALARNTPVITTQQVGPNFAA